MMPHRNGLFTCHDLGDEIAPGFHVGDRIEYRGVQGWVSNIQENAQSLISTHFVISQDNPNELLAEDPNDLCHGDYVRDLDEVVLLECVHPEPVSDEEIAALFGLTLLEMIDPTV